MITVINHKQTPRVLIFEILFGFNTNENTLILGCTSAFPHFIGPRLVGLHPDRVKWVETGPRDPQKVPFTP